MSPPPHALRKRSVVIAGHRTSLSLEQAFWDALKAIAAARGLSLGRLIAEIDERRSGNLSSAARVFVLQVMQGGSFPSSLGEGEGGGKDQKSEKNLHLTPGL